MKRSIRYIKNLFISRTSDIKGSRDCFTLCAIVVVFYVLRQQLWNPMLRRYPTVEGSADLYRDSVFLLATFINRFFIGPLGFFLVLLVGLIIHNFIRDNKVQMHDRILITLVTSLVALVLAFMPYNYYFDNLFFFDRICLLLYPVLIYFVPQFLLLFLLHGLIYYSQLNVPFGPTPLLHLRILFDLIMMAVAFLIVRPVRPTKSATFTFLIIIILLSNYFWAGLAKLGTFEDDLGWLQNRTHYLFLHNFVRQGWSGMGAFCRIFNDYDLIVNAVVIILEISSVFCFFDRKVLIVWSVIMLLFHLILIPLAGILFWPWILVLLILLVNNKSAWRSLSKDYGTCFKLLGIFLLLMGYLWLKPIQISWVDSPFLQRDKFYAEQDDKEKILATKFFRPYQYHFEYGAIKFNQGNTTTIGTIARSKPLDTRSRIAAKDFVRHFTSNFNNIGEDGMWWPLFIPFDQLIDRFMSSNQLSNGIINRVTVMEVSYRFESCYIVDSSETVIDTILISE